MCLRAPFAIVGSFEVDFHTSEFDIFWSSAHSKQMLLSTQRNEIVSEFYTNSRRHFDAKEKCHFGGSDSIVNKFLYIALKCFFVSDGLFRDKLSGWQYELMWWAHLL